MRPEREEKETSDFSLTVFESHVCHDVQALSFIVLFFSTALICHTVPDAINLVLQDPRRSMHLYLTEGPKSREMLLKDRISPIRNPYLSFPAWPADSYPVREVCRPPGTVQGGALQDRVAGS